MRPTNLIGSTVGEYRVIDFIGAGGMGEVYKATHTKIGRMAAVKVLTHVTGTEGMLERFSNEAQIQSSLHHPNIATLYDFAEINGLPCIIMEYVDGQTLAERVRPSGPLALAETLYIFQSVVEAITYMHNHGVVHRDIKSNNIKIGLDGQVKLLDFGIAKADSSPGLTATGSVIGTLEYLSPEQLMGGIADARSDIWALGVLLYEMATGRVPFEATTLGELCEKIKKVKYPPAVVLNPTVAQDVSAIIARCLRKNPMDRYRVAHDLLQDTKRLRELVPASEARGIRRTLAAKVRAAQQIWSRRAVWVAAGAAAIIILVSTVVYMATGRKTTADSSGTVSENSQSEGSAPADANGEIREVTIALFGGEADVYDQDNRFLKHITSDEPYQFKAKLGSQYHLILRREGNDTQVNGEVTDHNNLYHY